MVLLGLCLLVFILLFIASVIIILLIITYLSRKSNGIVPATNTDGRIAQRSIRSYSIYYIPLVQGLETIRMVFATDLADSTGYTIVNDASAYPTSKCLFFFP